MLSARPIFEALETRKLMAAEPVGLGNYLENSWRVDDPGFGGTRGSAMRADVSPMMRTRITGDLTASDVDMFRVGLAKGQFLNTKLDLTGTRLTVYDAAGKLAAKMARADELWQVPASGDYYLRLSDTTGAGKRAYNLDIRPIGLNLGKPDPRVLQSDATGVYVVRDGTSLHIAGPTGHGFSLIGDWNQKTTGSGISIQTTYSAGGIVKVRSIVGDIPIPVPSPASIRITTEPGQWGRYFGEIESIDLGTQLGPMDFATPFGRSWGMVFNNSLAGANLGGGGWGIRLGSDTLLRDTDLPLSPAVPYLFYTDQKGFTGNFGGINVNAVGSFGYSVVVDPADSFFIGAKGVPVVGDVAFGVSRYGLIPFTPNATPSGFTGEEMFGNVYIKAGLDISAIAPQYPVSIDGDIVIDLDANNDDKFLGGLKTNISKMLANGFTPEAMGNTAGRVFGDVSIGVNGRVNVGWEKGIFELSVPVGEGTLIYSATKQGIFARGRSVNPFDGTPLEIFKPRNTINIDAAVYRSGTFRLAADGTYNPGFYTMNGSIVVDNNGARASGTMRALGTNVRVYGSVQGDGRFSLTGKANVNLGPLSGNANFSLVNTNRAVNFGASFNAKAAITVVGVEIGGKVDAKLAFGVNSRGITYSGSGSAVLFAGPVSVGPIIGISNNNLAIGVDLGLLGKPTVNIPLPA
jgi:hypothetical protein